MDTAQIENVFQYHAPAGDQLARYDKIRAKAKEFAHLLNECCPDSREASVAFTKLQECVMFANASIAITESARAHAMPHGPG